MKRITTFAATHFSALQKPRRLVYITLLLLLILISSPRFSNAQSKDRDYPTWLTSNEISGELTPANKKANYYYAFMAGPGELTITVTVESGPGYYADSVNFELFDEDAKSLTSKYVSSISGRSEQAVERINVTRRQRILLRLAFDGTGPYRSPGKYRVRFGGAIDASRDEETSGGTDPVSRMEAASNAQRRKESGDCLPKSGTLIIKMKDGSKKIIDLNEAETITVVP